jgi:hypothetical protein
MHTRAGVFQKREDGLALGSDEHVARFGDVSADGIVGVVHGHEVAQEPPRTGGVGREAPEINHLVPVRVDDLQTLALL